MKQALKQIEKEDERANNVVVHGLDIDPSVPNEEQDKNLKMYAEACVNEIVKSDVEFCIVSQKILGKVGESGRAPPILIKLRSSIEAQYVIKNGSRLSKVKDFRRVFVTPDLSKDDRDKRRRAYEDLKKKITEFPEEH